MVQSYLTLYKLQTVYVGVGHLEYGDKSFRVHLVKMELQLRRLLGMVNGVRCRDQIQATAPSPSDHERGTDILSESIL